MAAFGIERRRLTNIKNTLNLFNKNFSEKIGGFRTNLVRELENYLIINHISKYPYEISHYNRGKETVQVFYLEEIFLVNICIKTFLKSTNLQLRIISLYTY